MKNFIAKALFNSHSYAEYRKIVTDLLYEGKSTGSEQSESLTNYSKLNEARMNRLDKTVKISEEVISKLQNLDNHYFWLVISEGWCGDAAQILPILNKMAHESGKIDLKIVLPEENEDLMDLFMTNGTRSIPKLIVVNKESGTIFGSWGPRPKGASEFLEIQKQKHNIEGEAAKNELQMWYLHDKGISVQDELVVLMLDWDLQNQQEE